jgi:hypothetical protein
VQAVGMAAATMVTCIVCTGVAGQTGGRGLARRANRSSTLRRPRNSNIFSLLMLPLSPSILSTLLNLHTELHWSCLPSSMGKFLVTTVTRAKEPTCMLANMFSGVT